MSSLLSKTRRLNQILQKKGTDPVSFDDICALLSDVLSCNVYILEKYGRVLGHTFCKDFECDIMKTYVLSDNRLPVEYNDKILDITETVANSKSKGTCVFKDAGECPMEEKISTIVPILGNRERLGALLLARFGEEFNDDDLVIAEYRHFPRPCRRVR